MNYSLRADGFVDWIVLPVYVDMNQKRIEAGVSYAGVSSDMFLANGAASEIVSALHRLQR